MCGAESNPSVVVSDGPRLVMVFSSGELQGGGFKANYSFETGKCYVAQDNLTKNYTTLSKRGL